MQKSGGGSEISTILGHHIARNIAHILITAGQNGSSQSISRTILERYGERLDVITTAALDLNRVMGEDVASCDLEAICVPEGIEFDDEDMDAIEEEEGEGELVLCTTELGLKRVVKKGHEHEAKWEVTALLKPKVALENIADGLPKFRRGP